MTAKLAPGQYRILTLRQPWAWLVVYGPKNIENRSWSVSYRGQFLILAGKEMLRREYQNVRQFAVDRGVDIPEPTELQFGGIIGSAGITHILPPEENTGKWSLPKQFGWVLVDRHPVEFVPCKGAQGFRYYEHREVA